ncbi:MAG: HAD-IIB family hydrolase [Myxococcota bacterium]
MSDAALRPLEELPTTTLNALRGVIFDVDDTLTREGVLEAEAFAAMHALAEAGLVLAAVTGRPLGWADVYAQQWPVAFSVGENGAGWATRRGGRFRVGYADDEGTRAAQRGTLERIRARVARELPNVRTASDQPARRCDLAFDVGEEVRLGEAGRAALVAIIEAEGARSTTSSVHCHAVPGLWDKARGAAAAARAVLGVALGEERGRWLFVGDSGNDAAAFAAFETSVGVANVRASLEALPIPPAYVTEADRGLGFAELAARILDARSTP